MSDGHITIRISAAADRSVDSVFGTIERRASRMRDNLSRTTGKGAGDAMLLQARQADRAASQAEKAAKRTADAQSREAARATKDVEKHYRQQQVALERSARAQDAIFERQSRQQMRLREREARESTRLADRQAHQEESWQRKLAYRTAYHGTIRYFPGMVGHAGRVAMDVLRGAGVNFDIGESVRRTVEWQGTAQGIRNQANIVGQDLSIQKIQDSIRKTSTERGFSREQMAEGVLDFGKVTGDPTRALQIAPEILKRAGAANATPEEMMGLAGDIASHLGEHVKDKAGVVLSVIDAAIMQGAKGAVELGQMTKLFPTIGASAGAFEGSEQQNMINLGALVQLARRTGGARNPAEAVTAIGRFKSQLTTAARYKQFQAAGVDVYSKSEPGKLRDPMAIIEESILKTGGDPLKLNKMFMSTIGIKPVEALRRKYIEERNSAIAGGASPEEASARGATAMKAAIAEFTNIESVAKAIAKNDQERSELTAVKAQKFRNALDDVTEKTMAKLLPALEKNADTFLDVAGKMGDLATWVVDNPKTAIAAGLALSVGRAGVESVFREAVERALHGGAAGGLSPLFGGGGAATTGGIVAAGGTRAAMMGGVARGLGAGLMGIAAYTGAEWLAGQYGASGSAQQTAGALAGGTAAGATFGGPVGALVGFAGGALVDSISGLYTQLKGDNWELFGNNKIAKASTPEEYDRKRAEYQKTRAVAAGAGGAAGPERVTAELDPTQAAKAFGDSLRSTTLRVVVTNASELRAQNEPKVDPGGRTP
jgi:hypothetical protein